MSRGRLTYSEWMARAEALLEVSEHLGQNWTDDATERRQGEIVADRLRTMRLAALRHAVARRRRDDRDAK
jgi:hypothetical protein